MSWQTQLAEMKGRTFDYQGQECHMLGYQQEGDSVTIATTLDDYEMQVDQVAVFLKDFCEPTPSPALRPAKRRASVGVLQLADSSALAKMQTALMDALEKVQKQPAYVPQAQAVSQLVQTGINLAKVELAALTLTQTR